MFYGSTNPDKNLRPNRKYYSADGTMEIKATFAPGNTTTPIAVEFVTYIGGDGYSAPIVLKSDGTTQNYLYLHRDYQGSILAITDANAAVLEKRLFDAWGAILKVQNGAGVDLNVLTILDRGYTGHEHLQSVGLINMNGRIYDPKLHRFLQPDNFVQDPSNTQNYNRYGYVLNNPLKYTDPSGESASCPTCGTDQQPYQGPNFNGALYDLLESQKGGDGWLGKNFSARNFDEAGTAVGKAFRDATNWVTSGVAGLFGNFRSAPSVNVRSNFGESFNNFAQQATVFGTNYVGTIATNNITFGIAQAPYAFTGTNFEGAERFGRLFGDITTVIQGALEDIGAGAGEVLSLGFATVPAGAVAIHGTAVAYGSGGRAISEARGLVDYFARDRSGNSSNKGTTFRGGSKQSRDGYLTKQPQDFQRWYHRFYKKNSSGPNMSDNEIDELLEEWNRMGRPKS